MTGNGLMAQYGSVHWCICQVKGSIKKTSTVNKFKFCLSAVKLLKSEAKTHGVLKISILGERSSHPSSQNFDAPNVCTKISMGKRKTKMTWQMNSWRSLCITGEPLHDDQRYEDKLKSVSTAAQILQYNTTNLEDRPSWFHLASPIREYRCV